MSSPKGKGSQPSNGESKSESVKKGNSSMCTNRSGSSGASQPMQIVSVSSEEINFLLYRYLQENGFVHTAFTFAYESMIGRSKMNKSNVPPGALISFIQKGLQYIGIEETLRQDGSNIFKRQKEGKAQKTSKGDANRAGVIDFSLLSPHSIRALSRRDPTIHLNVPPATAAAAIKAKLEAEANSDKESRQKTSLSRNGPLSPAPQSVTIQQQVQQRGAQKQRVSQSQHNFQQASVGISQIHQPSNSKSVKSSGKSSGSFVNGSMPAAVESGGVSKFSNQQQQRSGKGNGGVWDGVGFVKNNKRKLETAADTSSLSSVVSERSVLGKGSNKNKVQQQNTIPISPATPEVFESVNMTSTHLEDKQQIAKTNPLTLTSPQQQQQHGNTASSTSVEDDNKHKAKSNIGTNGSRNIASNIAGAEFPANSALPSNSTLPSSSTLPSPSGNGALNMAVAPTFTASSQQPLKQTNTSNIVRQSASNVSNNIDEEDRQTRAKPDEVLELNKHTSEVFMCAWNPIFTSLIATGSGDASARIWEMAGANARSGCGTSRLLQHGSTSTDRKNKDVTTLEWSSNGELLATGSYDGVARVWKRTGTLVHTLRSHRGPIFSLKWNKRGNYLLSGSYDKTTIVWDVSGEVGFVKQQFSHHFAPALDVDWKDDSTFASCSTDKTVHICQVGCARALHTYTGHKDEVNAVKWDPSGTLLASCSDDCTAKVWDVSSNRSGPLHDFKSHEQEIYTVKWSPTGQGSMNPTKSLMLATASFDGSVRLWNVQNGTCINVLSRHRDSVYSVCFSPSGEYLASGSLAGQLYIWKVQDGKHVKSFKGKGDIFEVAWNVEETRVAACFSSNVVNVIDFKS